MILPKFMADATGRSLVRGRNQTDFVSGYFGIAVSCQRVLSEGVIEEFRRSAGIFAAEAAEPS